jgi:hypothetical protein
MGQAKKEPKLDEVKFVLRKLQRLDPPAEEGAGAGSPSGAFTKAVARIPAAKGKNVRPGWRVILYLPVACVIIISAIILFAAGVRNVPDNSQSDGTLLAEARQALSEGDALRARRALLRAEPERHANVAFMLAQSYDPNYLQSLTKTNGLPDKAEAKRWYEKWYGLAVQSGLEMDSGRLQRIINAMR